MRNSKDKWRFHEVPRTPLSAGEASYWKNTFKKILKVGMEFEFNLPEKKNGSCKGDSPTCPCVYLTEANVCWTKCINTEACNVIARSPNVCENRALTCEVLDCAKCQHFKIICQSMLCPSFMSSCYLCEKFKTNCQDCEFRFDPNRNPEAIRKQLHERLRPNNSYGQVSESGVHSITTDGSLLGQKGAEIITVGRRVDYWEFLKMSQNIINSAIEGGAYFNERCSMHMHVLASYYGKVVPGQEKQGIPSRVNEMERDMPEIILANLHQLVRRYQNAMTWMTMGLHEPQRLTRWEKFRVSVLPISACIHHMSDVQSRVSHNAGGNKYGWINYNQIEFSPEGNVRRFHVEFRAADGILSASAAAAIACMYYALVIKAIEISRSGVLELGDDEWMEQATKMKEAMLNNMKGYQDGDRFGDTRSLYKYYDVLVEESLDLVRQLKAILIGIGPAYEVLEKLAEKPAALRRVDGDDWAKIEEDLKVIVNDEDKVEIALEEIITLNQIAECNNMEEWISAVGDFFSNDANLNVIAENMDVRAKVRHFVQKNGEDGKLIWSSRIGGPILI